MALLLGKLILESLLHLFHLFSSLGLVDLRFELILRLYDLLLLLRLLIFVSLHASRHLCFALADFSHLADPLFTLLLLLDSALFKVSNRTGYRDGVGLESRSLGVFRKATEVVGVSIFTLPTLNICPERERFLILRRESLGIASDHLALPLGSLVDILEKGHGHFWRNWLSLELVLQHFLLSLLLLSDHRINFTLANGLRLDDVSTVKVKGFRYGKHFLETLAHLLSVIIGCESLAFKVVVPSRLSSSSTTMGIYNFVILLLIFSISTTLTLSYILRIIRVILAIVHRVLLVAVAIVLTSVIFFNIVNLLAHTFIKAFIIFSSVRLFVGFKVVILVHIFVQLSFSSLLLE